MNRVISLVLLYAFCSTASAWSLVPQTRDIGYSCQIFPEKIQNRLPRTPFTIHIHDELRVFIFSNEYDLSGYTQNKSGRNFTTSFSQYRAALNGEEYETSNIIQITGNQIKWSSSVLGYGDEQKASGKCKKLKIDDGFSSHSITPDRHHDDFVSKPCTRNSAQCDLIDLCRLAVTQKNGSTVWQTSNESYKYASAARSRGALCGTKPVGVPKNNPVKQPKVYPKPIEEPSSNQSIDRSCETSPEKCSVSQLCRRATTGSNTKISWSGGKKDRPYVTYAQVQGLTCGITQPVKQTPKATQNIISSGTGFVISKSGDVVTNHHVVEGCDSIKATINHKLVSLSLVAIDTNDDVALLNSNSIQLPALLFEQAAIYPLQDVVAAGYPLIQQLGTSIKFTKGVISSLSGMGNRHSEFQLDAAIQPGNSGGPVVDGFTGNVLGMAVAKLAVSQKQIDDGFIPVGTNFAIKASMIRSFLDANNVEYNTGSSLKRTRQEISSDLTKSVLLLTCWK